MRKILYFLFFAVIFCASTQAQDAANGKRFAIGLIGGLDVIGTHQNDLPLRRIGGGFAGLNLSYLLIPQAPGFSLHFQPNWEISIHNGPRYYESNGFVFKSLNLPVLFRYNILKQSRIQPFIEVGAAFKVRLKSINRVENISCPFATPCRSYGEIEEELIPGSNKDNLILLAGVGVEVRLGAVKIPISVRFNEGAGTYSLMHGYDDRYPFTNLKNRTIQLVTGVSF